jgi:hypothetical protein
VRCNLKAISPALASPAKFALREVVPGSGVFTLRAGVGFCGTAYPDNGLRCASPGVTDAEKFVVDFTAPGGTLTLLSVRTGKYCTDRSKQAGIQCATDSPGPSERFQFSAAW